MNPDPEIRETSSPSHDLLMLADESPESVADYVGRSRCFVAQLAGRAVGQYLLLHTRPFTAEVVSIAVDPACQRRGSARRYCTMPSARPARQGSGGWRSVRARPAPDKSPSTNVADSCAAASTATISANITPPRSSKTASNAATWCASAWSSGPMRRPKDDAPAPRPAPPRRQAYRPQKTVRLPLSGTGPLLT